MVNKLDIEGTYFNIKIPFIIIQQLTLYRMEKTLKKTQISTSATFVQHSGGSPPPGQTGKRKK
jgi:hypothetical protein